VFVAGITWEHCPASAIRSHEQRRHSQQPGAAIDDRTPTFHERRTDQDQMHCRSRLVRAVRDRAQSDEGIREQPEAQLRYKRSCTQHPCRSHRSTVDGDPCTCFTHNVTYRLSCVSRPPRMGIILWRALQKRATGSVVRSLNIKLSLAIKRR